jgi:hypothetical protein
MSQQTNDALQVDPHAHHCTHEIRFTSTPRRQQCALTTEILGHKYKSRWIVTPVGTKVSRAISEQVCEFWRVFDKGNVINGVAKIKR